MPGGVKFRRLAVVEHDLDNRDLGLDDDIDRLVCALARSAGRLGMRSTGHRPAGEAQGWREPAGLITCRSAADRRHEPSRAGA